jgi:hypothetical protein
MTMRATTARRHQCGLTQACYIRGMLRRTISLVLAIIMAFQLSWTVAGTYCMHETGRAAEHFGHHPHVEDGHEFPVASKDKQTPAKQLAAHPHCASCHATAPIIYTPQPLLDVEWTSIAPQSVIVALSSVYTPPPERPQWKFAA